MRNALLFSWLSQALLTATAVAQQATIVPQVRTKLSLANSQFRAPFPSTQNVAKVDSLAWQLIETDTKSKGEFSIRRAEEPLDPLRLPGVLAAGKSLMPQSASDRVRDSAAAIDTT